LSRGIARAEGKDKPGAMQDFQKAADLFQQQGDKNNYQKALIPIYYEVALNIASRI
jgi:hypothetical protein